MREPSQASALTHVKLPAATTTPSSLIPGQEVRDLRKPGRLARKAPRWRDPKVTTRWSSYDAAALGCYRSLSGGCGWFGMGEENPGWPLHRCLGFCLKELMSFLYGASVLAHSASGASGSIIGKPKCWEKCFILHTLNCIKRVSPF